MVESRASSHGQINECVCEILGSHNLIAMKQDGVPDLAKAGGGLALKPWAFGFDADNFSKKFDSNIQ